MRPPVDRMLRGPQAGRDGGADVLALLGLPAEVLCLQIYEGRHDSRIALLREAEATRSPRSVVLAALDERLRATLKEG